MPEHMTLQYAAQQALDVQSACNLTAVIKAWDRILCSGVLPADSEAKFHHPVCQLFAAQVAHLTTLVGSDNNYFKAHEVCERLAKGEPV